MQAKAQNQQPDPQSLYLQAAAQQAQADAMKKQADTVLTQAKVEETHANTLKLLGEANTQQAEANMGVMQRFPDWDSTMSNSPSEVTDEMGAAIKQSPDPHALAYALAKRPDIAAQIASMPEGSQGQAVLALAQQIGK